ncbi:MAG TPA: hypothetical protein VIV66_19760 [Pyrinomonadaceae bacterium]
MSFEISASRELEAQTGRVRIESLNDEFAELFLRWCSVVKACEEKSLYTRVQVTSLGRSSIGEMILRSAAVVEQTCGGLTANLWDDPFEWTLPETLPTRASIIDYLNEVDTTRRRAFTSFGNDADLLREISLPSGEMTTLSGLLTLSLAKASEFYERAVAGAK